MERDEEYEYRIGPDDGIEFVSDAWLQFARENEAPELTRALVVGKPLMDFVTGEDTRNFYRLLLERVRARGVPTSIPFRCDSPTTARFMLLVTEPLPDGGVRFVGILLRSEPIEEMKNRRSEDPPDSPLISCSICRRFDTDDGWIEPESAAIRFGLMERPRVPVITYVVCPTCRAETRMDPAPNDQRDA